VVGDGGAAAVACNPDRSAARQHLVDHLENPGKLRLVELEQRAREALVIGIHEA
jgi:hypothetical protein